MGGRPKKLGVQQRALAVELYEQKRLRIADICQSLGISKPTLYACVEEASEKKPRTDRESALDSVPTEWPSRIKQS